MHRALAAANLVRVALLQGEACATVLEQHAEFVRSNAGPEGMEHRIDQRHAHAVFVDNGDVDGVFVHRLGPGQACGHGLFGVDQCCQFCRCVG